MSDMFHFDCPQLVDSVWITPRVSLLNPPSSVDNILDPCVLRRTRAPLLHSHPQPGVHHPQTRVTTTRHASRDDAGYPQNPHHR